MGADHDTTASPLPAMAVTVRGAPGTEAGVTADGSLAGPAPLRLVAVTVIMYAVPLVNPGNVAEVFDPGTVIVSPPGAAVTM